MSVIQQIQEKYAKLMAIIIAVALIIFVIMLAFENGGSLFRGSNSNLVGKVNGKEITYNQFSTKVTQQEEAMKQRYGSGEAVRQEALTQTWNQELSRLLIESETDKLGMQISKKEVGDILYGANPPDFLRQGFTDPNTGQFNAMAAKSRVEEIMKGKGRDAELKVQLSGYILQLEFMRLGEKYNSLLDNSVNYPKWMIEKENADNSLLAKVSYVMEPYSSIADSTITVSNKEIEDYISRHKKDFKQEESRSLAYVAFSALPTSADTAASLNGIIKLKPEFDTTAAVADFINQNASQIPYSEIYVPKSQMQTANQQIGLSVKDTLFSLAPNAVFGPYLDGGNYVLAKLMSVKTLPDSVKCRHILLGTVNPQTNQPIMDDSVAHKLADSIALAIRNGASFDTLETTYSTDEVAKRDKGVMTFSSVQIQEENFAKEFGQFILFDGKPGDKKVVKTPFGWHYIEILDFIKPEPHYQVAYLAKPIEASDATEAAATNEATQFANNSRDLKSFDANAEKLKTKGINKIVVPGITPTAYQVQGLGISRAFVKNIYEADKGEVMQPERVGENWVVAVVTEVNKKGTMSASMARPMVEPLLRNEKKAEQIRKKLGAATTLEAAATAFGKQITTVDSVRFNDRATAIGYEPKIVGAAFNPANKGKVVPGIAGNNGVYVLRVDNVAATSVVNANVAEERKLRLQQYQMQVQQMLMQGMDPGMINLSGLREAADIKDYRAKIY